MLALFVVEPHRAVLRPDRCDERLAIRGHGYSLLRRRPKRQLLRFPVRKLLSPDVSLPVIFFTQIHPFAVGAPGGVPANTVRVSHHASFAVAVKGNHSARHYISMIVHLDYEYPLPVRREVRVMRHASLSGWDVHISAIPAVLIRGHNRQVHS